MRERQILSNKVIAKTTATFCKVVVLSTFQINALLFLNNLTTGHNIVGLRNKKKLPCTQNMAEDLELCKQGNNQAVVAQKIRHSLVFY